MKAVRAARQKRQEIKDALLQSSQSFPASLPSAAHNSDASTSSTLEIESESQSNIQQSLQARMEKQMLANRAQEAAQKKEKDEKARGESTDMNDTCNYLLLNPHETEVFDQVGLPHQTATYYFYYLYAPGTSKNRFLGEKAKGAQREE